MKINPKMKRNADNEQNSKQKFTLSHDYIPEIRQLIPSKYFEEKIKCGQINISFQSWKRYCQLMPYIQMVKCYKIKFQNNFRSTIIKEIAHIQFRDLKKLNLSTNAISNLESLAFADMQDLNELNLHMNNITNIKGLQKANWPQLTTLRLGKNKLREIKLGRIKTDYEKMELLEVTGNISESGNYAQLVKIESRWLQNYPGTKQMINQEKVTIKINERFIHSIKFAKKNMKSFWVNDLDWF